MKTSKRRSARFVVGSATAAALMSTVSPAHAQGFGGLNPGAAAGTPFPTLGWRAGTGGQAAPAAPQYGQTSVVTPYAGPYGGYPFQYGSPYGFSPYGGQGYGDGYSYRGGYRATVRSYQLPGQVYQAPGQILGVPGRSPSGYARIQAVNPEAVVPSGGSGREMGVLPEGRVGTISVPRPVTHGQATITTAPVPVTSYTPAYDAPPTTEGAGPALLGGYYYGGYCDGAYGSSVYPSVYGDYDGFPGYITAIGPGLSITSLPTPPVYVTDPEPFSPPSYTVNYNQTNYYVTNEDRADEIAQGGPDAQAAVKRAYPADSYQAAFADIERAWDNGDVSLLKKHLHSDDTKVSVFLKSAYKYSLNSSDFAQITRDAFDRLNTVSFKFTALQKAKNGDVTAYGTHVYHSEMGAADGAVVAFDPDAAPTDGDTDGGDSSDGTDKTVYVSYTLRHGDTGWYVTAINSSTEPLLKAAP